MAFPKSIRWRLQLWYGALLVAVLCGFGFTAFHFEKGRRLRRIDEELQLRLSALVDALRAGARGADREHAPAPRFTAAQAALFGDSAGHYYAIWMQGAKPATASRNAPANLPKPGSHDAVVRMRGDARETFLFAAPVNCALVGRSIAADEAELRRFAAALAGIGAVVLGAGLLGGWWLASRAIVPIEAISAAAAKIAGGDLAQRIRGAETDSELGRLAAVLNSTFARLEAVFAQQARFTADAAHELRTPISVVLTHAQNALAAPGLSDEHREALEAIQRASQRMRRLIESLLELARLDAGQEPLRREPCDLSQLAADGIELIRPLAGQRGIAIHAELSAAPCECDPERVAQVLTNLLSNAITYNRDRGSVRVTTERGDGTARIVVHNTGAGIAAEDLPHIFERFRRADAARTASQSGLGLAIAQAIVQAHGGSIEASSQEGRGATFVVTLPA